MRYRENNISHQIKIKSTEADLLTIEKIERLAIAYHDGVRCTLLAGHDGDHYAPHGGRHGGYLWQSTEGERVTLEEGPLRREFEHEAREEGACPTCHVRPGGHHMDCPEGDGPVHADHSVVRGMTTPTPTIKGDPVDTSHYIGSGGLGRPGKRRLAIEKAQNAKLEKNLLSLAKIEKGLLNIAKMNHDLLNLAKLERHRIPISRKT